MKTALVCLSVLIAVAYAAPNTYDAATNIPGGRIIGGNDAVRGQVPYQASVRYCYQGNCQHTCGGAIIGSLWVLSAAHCITQAPALGSYEVLAGVLNLDDENPERQIIRVSYVLIHPDYQGGINPHDLAIFRLASPLTFNNQVEPINLPAQDEEPEDSGILSGWGSTTATEVPTMPQTLQYIQTPIVAPGTCKTALDSILGNRPHPLDQEANLCTGPLTGGVSICTGDSGSPVADIQGQKLIGIGSWFVTPCGTVGAPSVHVKVSHYIRWIRSSISV